MSETLRHQIVGPKCLGSELPECTAVIIKKTIIKKPVDNSYRPNVMIFLAALLRYSSYSSTDRFIFSFIIPIPSSLRTFPPHMWCGSQPRNTSMWLQKFHGRTCYLATIA